MHMKATCLMNDPQLFSNKTIPTEVIERLATNTEKTYFSLEDLKENKTSLEETYNQLNAFSVYFKKVLPQIPGFENLSTDIDIDFAELDMSSFVKNIEKSMNNKSKYTAVDLSEVYNDLFGILFTPVTVSNSEEVENFLFEVFHRLKEHTIPHISSALEQK